MEEVKAIEKEPPMNNLELLPAKIRKYSEIIGLENLLKLSEAAGGRKIYIPKKDCILKYFLVEEIQKEYNGRNAKELAEKYGVDKRTVFKYLKKK